MAMNAALEGVKRVLKEEKKEGNSAAAIRNCQALHVGVLELLQAVERHRAGDSCNGGAGETTRELSRLLCHCFSVSAQILTLCKVLWARSRSSVSSGVCLCRRWRVVPAGCLRISPPISLLSSSQPTLSSKFAGRNIFFSLVSRCLGVDRVARQVESQSGDI
jgi:hypothetical protein